MSVTKIDAYGLKHTLLFMPKPKRTRRVRQGKRCKVLKFKKREKRTWTLSQG